MDRLWWHCDCWYVCFLPDEVGSFGGMVSDPVTFEEARKCPRCKEPGRDEGSRRLEGGKGRLVTLRCLTQGCRWFGTTYVVQVRLDGTVPAADTRPRTAENRLYMPNQEDIDRMTAAAERTHDASMRPGGELRGR